VVHLAQMEVQALQVLMVQMESSGTSGSSGTDGSSGTSGSSATSGSSGLSGDIYKTTSSSTMTLGTDPSTIVVGTGLAYTPGQAVLTAHNSSNYQICEVLSYDSRNRYHGNW